MLQHRGAQGIAPRPPQPLQNAQRPLGVGRGPGKERGINPDPNGVLGFSAGRPAPAPPGASHHCRTYPPVDDTDRQSCRPTFAVLIYPAYLASEKKDGSIAPEVKPNADTPPTFLFQTEDDPIGVENSLYYYAALKNAKVPAEMHI